MGNCCTAESSSSVAYWAGEDWDSLIDAAHDNKRPSSSYCSRSSELKIKISKKELEELLEKAKVQGLSTDQFLGRLINQSASVRVQSRAVVPVQHHQRPWRPTLNSITEVN